MIKKLYEIDCFNYQRFILDNLKSLSLSSDEALVLINILDNYKDKNEISMEKLKSKMNLSLLEIQEVLTGLMDKDFYSIYILNENGLVSEKVTLDGFFQKAKAIVNKNKSNNLDDIQKIMSYVSTKLNRLLTNQEIEIIQSLIVEDNYEYNDFENAISKLENSHKVISVKAIAQAIVIKPENKMKVNPSNDIMKDFFNSIK